MISDALKRGEVGRMKLTFANADDGKPMVVLVMVLRQTDLMIQDAENTLMLRLEDTH